MARPKYKCPSCSYRTDQMPELYKHINRKHKADIPKGHSVRRYLVNTRQNKTHGSCVICRKPTEWNEDKGRYERYCSDRCRKEAGARARKNSVKVYGVTHRTKQPEFQAYMQSQRSIGGKYKWKDGTETNFLASYEEDFLRFCEEELNYTSKDVVSAADYGIFVNYVCEGVERIYMPDFYIPMYGLIVEIKDGGNNKNTGYAERDRYKEKLKDLAMIEEKKYNYIKIVNKEYDQFVSLLPKLKNQIIDINNKHEKYIIIPK